MNHKYEKIHSLLREFGSDRFYSGNILIAEGSSIAFEATVGFADILNTVPLTLHHSYDIASLSKSFTAYGVLLLQQLEALSLRDPVEKYIPNWPYRGITINHLVFHFSGLPDYLDFDYFVNGWSNARHVENQDIIDYFVSEKPDPIFNPGDKWSYSNTGYVLLASIVERQSGQSFESFIKENVFDPLKLNNTYFNKVAPVHANPVAKARLVKKDGDGLISPELDEQHRYSRFLSTVAGDGCITSTIHDVFRWVDLCFNNETKFPKEVYLTTGVLKSGDMNGYTKYLFENGSTGYGYGWFVTQHPDYGSIVYHTGGWPGYSSVIIKLLDHDKTVIHMSNTDYILVEGKTGFHKEFWQKLPELIT